MEEEEGGGALERVIGRFTDDAAGPTFICIAGLHGNEPSGVQGLKRVFKTLQQAKPSLNGEFVGLAGNLSALAQHRRFIDYDLNRCWSAATVEAHAPESDFAPTTGVEAREQRELFAELERIFDRARGEVYVLDLHSASGDGAPFAVLNDTLRNREFALAFPVTIVLGVAENLGGTLMDYINDFGHVNIGFEAGQHDDPAAVDNAEAAVWVGLAATGCVASGLPEMHRSRSRLTQARGPLPRVAEVRYRHAIARADGFRMEPGFLNFQRITTGQLLARDRRGEIRSRKSGRMLMPHYQELGEDGFFVIREFRPHWLAASALLRRLRFDAIVHWLPGVRRHPKYPGTLIVDRRIARWRALDLLHLLGFRKQRAIGNVLLISRRARPRPPRPRRRPSA